MFVYTYTIKYIYNCQGPIYICHLRIKNAPLMCLRSAVVGFPGIIETNRQHKVKLSLSRWRERGGVRVGLNYIPLTFVLSPWGRGD
jgi:hypothetical protein